MTPRPITRAGPESAPFSYVLGQQEGFTPKSVSAVFDGAGASGQFLPCLSFYTQDGKLVARNFPSNTSVGVGQKVEVTYHPFLTSAGVAAPPGAMISTYQGQATAADFVWTGPAGVNVSSGYPLNNTWTKLLDASSILIISEGDFTPGAAEDILTMGLWIDGNNEINVASATLGGWGFSSVQLARVISPTSLGTGPLAAGSHTLDMRVSSATGQTTTFRTHAATDLTIIEFIPASLQ